MSPKYLVAICAISLVVSMASLGMTLVQIYFPSRPVSVPAVAQKEWEKDKQFKRAVETIAETTAESVIDGRGYMDQDDVEKCIIQTNRQLKCP